MTPFIRLHPSDDVVIARSQLLSGARVEDATVKGLIPPGHKVATRAIAPRAGRREERALRFAARFKRSGLEHGTKESGALIVVAGKNRPGGA